MRLLALLSFIFIAAPSYGHAAESCTLIVSYPGMKTLREDGNCNQRQAPASSFKIPLAVIGFDSGVLKDAHTPSLPYKDTYASDMEIQKKTTDPTIWLQESIVWYSQQLTLKLGMKTFQTYVDQFSYGNKDLSGGLTQAWLGSSLEISPREQVTFLIRLLNHDLGVGDDACTKTIAIIPQFSAGKWKVFGKTGTSWQRRLDGGYDRTQPLGWFVGWAEKEKQKVVFAKLIRGTEKWDQYGGPKAREEFLKELASFPAEK